MHARALVHTRRADAMGFMAEAIGMDEKTLRVALSRYRNTLEAAERAKLDRIDDKDRPLLFIEPSWMKLTDSQIAERLDQRIGQALTLLKSRRRALFEFDEHGRSRLL